MAEYSALPDAHDPFAGFNWFSQAAMWWCRRYLVASHQITEKHVSSLPSPVDLSVYTSELERAWSAQQQGPLPSFLKATISVFGGKYLRYMLPFVFGACGQVAIAVTISRLTACLRDESSSLTEQLALALIYSLCSLFSICMANQGFFRGHVLTTMIRSTVFTVLYEKALRLSLPDLGNASARLTNFVAADMDMLEQLGTTWYVLVTPLFVVIATPVVYWLIGAAGVISVGFILLFPPVKYLLTKFIARFYRTSVALTDSRLEATRTLTTCIKHVKLHSWEQALIAEIEQIRRKEYFQQCSMNAHRNLTTTLFFSGGAVLTLVTLVVFTSLGNSIDAGRMFGALGILFTLNNWVAGAMSTGFDMCALYQTLFGRLTEFMSLQERREQIAGIEKGLQCEGLSAAWGLRNQKGEKAGELALEKVSFEAGKGELVMVVGAVGSGKTALLAALNGDLQVREGRIAVSAKAAYVAQEPWIICSTIRENILMGQPYSEFLYAEVIAMCGLQADFQQMAHSDLTVVGESGSTLSGGQKARIALARAVYRNRELYLLDDPLSAVDAQVGLQVFTDCIMTGLRGKTRVLVTSNPQFLPHADRILLMQEGKVVLQAPYAAVSSTLHSLFASTPHSEHCVKGTESIASLQPSDDESSGKDTEDLAEADSVPLQVYFDYLLLYCRSKWVLLAIVLLMVLLQAASLSSSYWVSYWAMQSPAAQQHSGFMWGLAGIVAVLVGLCVLRNYVVLEGLNVCNQKLHRKAIEGLASTDLAFFERNSTGRILSRFTKDIALVENVLLKFFSDMLLLWCHLLSYIAALVITTPHNLLFLLPLLAAIWKVARRLVAPIRQLKRLELTTKADIVTHIHSTIAGISTIRSLDITDRYRSLFRRKVQANFQAWFCFMVNYRTFQVYSDYLGMLFLSGNALLCVLLKGHLPADVLAVGLTFTVLVISYMGWFGYLYIAVGTQMISVQRLDQYAQLCPESDEYKSSRLRVTSGQVEFELVSLRYSPERPFALRDVSFLIPGGSKTGVVGRTGAGKSSLLLAAFRLKPLHAGRVLMDEQDIALVALQSLRTQIAVIPQSPVVFSADLRGNVDPTSRYSGEEIDSILSDLQLSGVAHANANDLSVGQKQLLCLARALLRDCQVLFFDEATGSIDPATESLVQKAVFERMREKTIITIAHRLSTILQCELVIVMENGQCVGCGRPESLERENAVFRTLLQASRSE